MISLEQVRALEARVEKAVAFIATLRAENASLKDGLLEAELRTEAAEARTAELEGLIKEFQKDQERIEEGIVQALLKLDAFEDVVHAAAKPPAASGPASAASQAPVQVGAAIPKPSPTVSVVEDESDAAVETARHTGTETVASGEAENSDSAATLAEASTAEDSGQDQSDGLDIF